MKKKKPILFRLIAGLYHLIKNLLQLSVILLVLLFLVALYPVWRIFVWIVNLVGTEGLRNKDGNLQTPIVFYEHPETKQKVVFIATCHVGEKSYFAELQRFIDSLEGHTILFERVIKMTQKEAFSMNKKERFVFMQLNQLFKMIREVGQLLSLQYQMNGLSYPETWINTDVRSIDLIRHFAKNKIHFSKEGKKFGSLLEEDASSKMFIKWIVNQIFNRFAAISVLANVAKLFSSNKRKMDVFILGKRNEVAVQAIHEHLKNGDVATIWGAAHLKGIRKQLCNAGFREVRREWYTVYHKQGDTFLQCVKKLIAENIAKEERAKEQKKSQTSLAPAN